MSPMAMLSRCFIKLCRARYLASVVSQGTLACHDHTVSSCCTPEIPCAKYCNKCLSRGCNGLCQDDKRINTDNDVRFKAKYTPCPLIHIHIGDRFLKLKPEFQTEGYARTSGQDFDRLL
jgi:hypothetical protein